MKTYKKFTAIFISIMFVSSSVFAFTETIDPVDLEDAPGVEAPNTSEEAPGVEGNRELSLEETNPLTVVKAEDTFSDSEEGSLEGEALEEAADENQNSSVTSSDSSEENNNVDDIDSEDQLTEERNGTVENLTEIDASDDDTENSERTADEVDLVDVDDIDSEDQLTEERNGTVENLTEIDASDDDTENSERTVDEVDLVDDPDPAKPEAKKFTYDELIKRTVPLFTAADVETYQKNVIVPTQGAIIEIDFGIVPGISTYNYYLNDWLYDYSEEDKKNFKFDRPIGITYYFRQTDGTGPAIAKLIIKMNGEGELVNLTDPVDKNNTLIQDSAGHLVKSIAGVKELSISNGKIIYERLEKWSNTFEKMQVKINDNSKTGNTIPVNPSLTLGAEDLSDLRLYLMSDYLKTDTTYTLNQALTDKYVGSYVVKKIKEKYSALAEFIQKVDGRVDFFTTYTAQFKSPHTNETLSRFTIYIYSSEKN